MSTTKTKKNPMQLNGVKLRISQGAVAKKAIHNIELLFRKMDLDPKAVKGSKRRLVGTMSVPTKAEAFAQRVRDSILVAKSDVGSGALAVYASLKGIVRRPEGAQYRDSFRQDDADHEGPSQRHEEPRQQEGGCGDRGGHGGGERRQGRDRGAAGEARRRQGDDEHRRQHPGRRCVSKRDDTDVARGEAGGVRASHGDLSCPSKRRF